MSPREVAPGVWRITCANPGPMTHTGTQSYLVEAGGGAVVLIDPGPEDAAHREALLAALPGGARIEAVLVTHAHRDHSEGASALAAATGAPVLAFGPYGAGMSETMRGLAAAGDLGGGEGADRAFRPDRRLAEGELLEIGGRGIRALHMPGHLSDHLCFALEGEGVLFTGDTVMGWSTTLVSPPEGDMAAFMASLRRLAARAGAGADRLYLPGHGEPVEAPAALLAEQIAHREARAKQALDALGPGPADARSLVPRIYAGLAPGLLPAAERNLLATLIWLAEEGRVVPLGPVARDARFRLA